MKFRNNSILSSRRKWPRLIKKRHCRTKTFLKTTLNATHSLSWHLLTLYYVPHTVWSTLHIIHLIFTRIPEASTIVFTSWGWALPNYYKLQIPQELLILLPFHLSLQNLSPSNILYTLLYCCSLVSIHMPNPIPPVQSTSTGEEAPRGRGFYNLFTAVVHCVEKWLACSRYSIYIWKWTHFPWHR